MLAKVHSFILVGIDAMRCEVEADVSQRGLPKTTLVGLAQAAVKESIERVRRSMINSGFGYPSHANAVNLAPADVKKEGPALDLPIAIGLLLATGFIQGEFAKEFLIAGELALDGRLRKIRGALPMALGEREKISRRDSAGGECARSGCRRGDRGLSIWDAQFGRCVSQWKTAARAV